MVKKFLKFVNYFLTLYRFDDTMNTTNEREVHTMRTLDTSKYLYSFVGGQLDGKLWHYAALEARGLINGYSEDMSAVRASGRLCKRAELDNQPLVNGYYPPMYDGVRYEVNGVLKYDFQCTDAEKQAATNVYHVIRYETAEVYNSMCD